MAHLLIVDDDANTLASLARAFRMAGHEATVCDSAARALDLVRTQRFDLIFSDVVMPGKDGISFLEDLKALGLATPGRDDVGPGQRGDGRARHPPRRRRFPRKAPLHR
jgi:Response regulator containing CheY-like receiver, AAA-type ATPase, and DNA-binding domains